MKCEECRELLWIYLEWETMPEDTEKIKAHLAECPECRKEAAKQMGIMETLHSLPEAELPEGYHTELMQKIMAEAPEADTEKTAAEAAIPAVAPTEWKVVRKTEILQKAKEKKELEKKRRGIWKRWSAVAAAVLVIVAVGGINGIIRMRQEPLEPMQPVSAPAEGNDEGIALYDAAKGVEPIAAKGIEDAVTDEKAALDTGGEQKDAARENGRTEEGQRNSGTDTAGALRGLPGETPAVASAAPKPESAPEVRSIAPVMPDLATAYEMPMELAISPDTAAEKEAEETESIAETAEAKQGDTVTLRAGNGGDVYDSLSRAVVRNAGFEQETENAGGVLAMIPVENMDAFYAELQEIGEIEWQAQGQEQPGAAYRRVEILVE